MASSAQEDACQGVRQGLRSMLDLSELSLSFLQLLLGVDQVRVHVVEPVAVLDEVSPVCHTCIEQLFHLSLECAEGVFALSWLVAMSLEVDVSHFFVYWNPVYHGVSSSERLD